MDAPDPRLVEQLRDLHFPDPPSSWPPAPGWWIAGAIVLIMLVTAVRWWHQRSNKKYSSPVANLQGVYRHWQQHQDAARYLQDVNTLLRCYALRRDGRTAIARLQGTTWRRWLDADTDERRVLRKTSTLSPATLRALTLECYQAKPSTHIDTVHDDIKQWLHGRWLRGQRPHPASSTEQQRV